MSYIDFATFEKYIKTAIDYYNHIKNTRRGGIVDFGSNESDMKIGNNIFKNVLVRPIDENNVIINLKYNNIIDKHYSTGEFKFSKDFISDPINTFWITGKNIPFIYRKIKKINCIDNNVKSFSFKGTDLTNFDNLRFETDLTLDYYWNNARDVKDFSGLNNCRIPVLRLFGCKGFESINEIRRESIPIIKIMNDDGYPYNMFYYKGLRLESIINDRIILNSNDKTNDSNRAFNEYFEFIKAHPDVYDNPIKSYVFNEIYYVFTNLNSNGKLDISLLQLFNKELNQWGYNLDSDNSIDKIKNRLINLLLK